jgi:hypothetical protein
MLRTFYFPKILFEPASQKHNNYPFCERASPKTQSHTQAARQSPPPIKPTHPTWGLLRPSNFPQILFKPASQMHNNNPFCERTSPKPQSLTQAARQSPPLIKPTHLAWRMLRPFYFPQILIKPASQNHNNNPFCERTSPEPQSSTQAARQSPPLIKPTHLAWRLLRPNNFPQILIEPASQNHNNNPFCERASPEPQSLTQAARPVPRGR